jgi:hypothetical protein
MISKDAIKIDERVAHQENLKRDITNGTKPHIAW